MEKKGYSELEVKQGYMWGQVSMPQKEPGCFKHSVDHGGRKIGRAHV